MLCVDAIGSHPSINVMAGLRYVDYDSLRIDDLQRDISGPLCDQRVRDVIPCW